MKATVRIIGVPPVDLIAIRAHDTELHATRIEDNRLQLLPEQCVIGQHVADLAACWKVLRDYALASHAPSIEGWDELDGHITYDLIGTGG